MRSANTVTSGRSRELKRIGPSLRTCTRCSATCCGIGARWTRTSGSESGGRSGPEPIANRGVFRPALASACSRGDGGSIGTTPPVGIYNRMWGAARHDAATGVDRPLSAEVMVFEAIDRPGDRFVRAQLDLCGLAHPT
jgi:hypothetical protein